MIMYWNFFHINQKHYYERIVYTVSDFISALGGTVTGLMGVIKALLLPLTWKLNEINAQKSIQAKKKELKLEVEDIDYPAITSLRFMWLDMKETMFCCRSNKDNDHVFQAKELMEKQIVEFYDMQNTYKIPNLEKQMTQNVEDIEFLMRKQ